MEIRAVNAYHGACPMCKRSQTSLTPSGVDILCIDCKYIADEILYIFEIPSKDLYRDVYAPNREILTMAKRITCMHYATEHEYEMILPAGVKKIIRL